MLHLKPYSEIKHLEGIGNFAVSKYYKFPFSFFYRHKLKMSIKMLEKSVYKNILDFGTGSGILLPELRKHAQFAKGIDKLDVIDKRWKYDVVICNSVLEFVDLKSTLTLLKSILSPKGILIVASPMDNWLSRLYFRLIKDRYSRHSHKKILTEISKHFKIRKYKTWLGLYFAVRATAR